MKKLKEVSNGLVDLKKGLNRLIRLIEEKEDNEEEKESAVYNASADTFRLHNRAI